MKKQIYNPFSSEEDVRTQSNIKSIHAVGLIGRFAELWESKLSAQSLNEELAQLYKDCENYGFTNDK